MNPLASLYSDINVVPWYDKEEFINAYHDLYSDNICEQRRGLDQVAVWKARIQPLPRNVEATTGFVTSIIQHAIFNNTVGPLTEIFVQSLYCSAITRFVHLILEKDEPDIDDIDEIDEISLSARAAEHNIPTWVIDMRNDIVHSYMPTLSLLRYCADFCLKYLKETYWTEAIENVEQAVIDLTKFQKHILKLIKEYKGLQFRIIIEFLTEEESKYLSQKLKDVLEKMSCYIIHSSELFIETLVEPGNFASFEDLDILLNSKGIKFLEQTHFIIPYKLQKFWFPLLRELHEKDLLSMFLKQLLLAQDKTKNKICHKLTIAWSLEIFEGGYSKSILTPLFLEKGILLDPLTIAFCCVSRPNHYSKELLVRITARVSGKKKKICQKFCFLVAMYLGYFVSEEDVKNKSESIMNERIYTMEDVKKYARLKDSIALQEKDGAESDDSDWCLAPETMDFSQIPIGTILNPIKKERKINKLEPSVVDDDNEGNFIIGENVDPNDFMDEPPSPTLQEMVIPEDFDMVYRPSPKK